MKTYIYTIEHSSPKRGYNRTVSVWRIKNNTPLFVGYDAEINTASYKGDHAIACEIINKVDNHKMSDCGYYLKSNLIKVLGI